MSANVINTGRTPGRIEIVRCQRTIGAEIRGVDLSKPLAKEQFQAVYAALIEHKVIFFRNQPVTADQQIAFAGRFGELETNPFRPQGEGKPELQIVKNDKDNPVLSTDVWHADLTFRKKPTKFTILKCIETPEPGGDTLWADMCAAYDGLSEQLRSFIAGLKAVHDFKNFRVLYKNNPEKRNELHQLEDMFPNPLHPVVITHPDTLQRVLFVNRQFTLRIVGMSDFESRELLEILYAQSGIPEYQFRLKWRPGTVAVWDNRSCQHYAVNDYYPERRHMERVAVAGDAEPYFDPDARPVREYNSIKRTHAHEGLH
jgi:taurine dioxygenase